PPRATLFPYTTLFRSQLEESLRDRLSFRRFAGLCVDEATPDETSFVLFRRRLREAGLHESLFAGVVEQLAEAGVLVREGAMVDRSEEHTSELQSREKL